ncbi:TPA: hypothetical protein ACGSC8_005059, partial [Escherichia coli]
KAASSLTLQQCRPSSISSCERCSADGISASLFHRRNVAFSLTSEINRVSVVAPGRIIVYPGIASRGY